MATLRQYHTALNDYLCDLANTTGTGFATAAQNGRDALPRLQDGPSPYDHLAYGILAYAKQHASENKLRDIAAQIVAIGMLDPTTDFIAAMASENKYRAKAFHALADLEVLLKKA
jgi:hypothetical protein